MSFSSGGKESNRITKSSERRAVLLFSKVPMQGRYRIFAFSYADLADYFGVTVDTVRTLVSKGKVDPMSFESIFAYKKKTR